ncbi:MAG: LD-carboxypeptidase [Chitinophagaceae bacterium]
MTQPIPYLQKGDTIGITCPAGAVSMDTMQPMIEQLETWGFNVHIGTTVGTSYFKFSACDQERLNDFQSMLDDTNIKAILFGRGGYGMVRIIDLLDFSKFAKHPKWLLGYSDITCLHNHVHTHFALPTIHAHMSGAYHAHSQDLFSTQTIFDTLSGNALFLQIPSNTHNRVGEASGIVVGGNLALLSDLCGTNSDIDTSGKILVIEDIGEYKYNIDRMLWQLKKVPNWII